MADVTNVSGCVMLLTTLASARAFARVGQSCATRRATSFIVRRPALATLARLLRAPLGIHIVIELAQPLDSRLWLALEGRLR